MCKLAELAESQRRDPANIVTRRTGWRMLRPDGQLALRGNLMGCLSEAITTTKITRPSGA